MPRYSKETTAALKRVLMCRRDKGYRFNEGDLPGLTQETGLNRTDIIRWAHHVRDYYNTPEDMEKYFSQNGVVNATEQLSTPVDICSGALLFLVFFSF